MLAIIEVSSSRKVHVNWSWAWKEKSICFRHWNQGDFSNRKKYFDSIKVEAKRVRGRGNSGKIIETIIWKLWTAEIDKWTVQWVNNPWKSGKRTAYWNQIKGKDYLASWSMWRTLFSLNSL